jgi:hypothetical protein
MHLPPVNLFKSWQTQLFQSSINEHHQQESESEPFSKVRFSF